MKTSSLFGLLLLCVACSAGPERTGASAHGAGLPTDGSPLVTHTGYGSVQVGQTRLEAERALNASLPLDTLDMVTEGCGHVALPGAPGVDLMIYEDTVVRVEVYERGVFTFAGDQVGDLQVEVLRRHPTARVDPHPYDFPEGHYLVVPWQSDTTYQLIFETDGQQVTRYRSGRLPPVAWIEGCL